MIKILSIAGSDPSGGAGIQLDLKVFQRLGVFGLAVPAALTVQNSRGVSGVHALPPDVLSDQLASLLPDIKPAAVKTGMLLSRQNIEVVAASIKKYRIRNLVIDPVLRSSSGAPLMQQDSIQALKKALLPLALIVTPNVMEAEVLSGISILCEGDMDFAAGMILDRGPAYVLIKGGHLKGPATDTLYGGKTVLSFSTPRRKGEFHGTGCALSAAIAVFIGMGYAVEKAVEKAKQLVDSLLKTAKPVGKGRTKYFQF